MSRHGYAVVYQDCRGRYRSAGRFTKYLSEAEDGYDTLAWLMRQSWCNGRIGTFGLSYAAHTQAALGCLDPPGLAAQFLDCGGFSNAYRSGIRHGGAFDLKQATWAYNNALADAKDPAVKAALRAEDIKAWFARMPWRKGQSPVSAAPEYEDYLFEQWSHGVFDDFWKRPGIYAEGYYDRYADVPTGPFVGLVRPVCAHGGGELPRTVAHQARSGAADPRSVDAWRPLAELCRRRRFRRRRPRSTAISRTISSRCADAGSIAGSRTSLTTPMTIRRSGSLSWAAARDGADGAGRLDHGGRWRTAADWPLPQTRWTKFYLHADRTLGRELPDHGGRPLDYVSDPRHPVPTIGGALSSGEPVMRGGAYDQREGPEVFGAREPFRPLAERRDVLVFSTPPLARDLEVTGPVTVRLWIASDGPDTDFTAKLIDCPSAE